MNCLECEEFRELLLYDAANLTDEDIPHRTKLRELIHSEFERYRAKLRDELHNVSWLAIFIIPYFVELTVLLCKRALGRISFTTDLWTDPILRAFMAVTVHYLMRNEDNRLILRTRLLAFNYLEGHHKGDNLADAFFKILKSEGLVERVCTLLLMLGSFGDDLACI